MKLPAGETLIQGGIVKGCERYTVKKSDSLRSIAEEQGIPYQLLSALNPQLESSHYKISDGMVITIPTGLLSGKYD